MIKRDEAPAVMRVDVTKLMLKMAAIVLAALFGLVIGLIIYIWHDSQVAQKEQEQQINTLWKEQAEAQLVTSQNFTKYAEKMAEVAQAVVSLRRDVDRNDARIERRLNKEGK
jgi:uncharacterized protein HemX